VRQDEIDAGLRRFVRAGIQRITRTCHGMLGGVLSIRALSVFQAIAEGVQDMDEPIGIFVRHHAERLVDVGRRARLPACLETLSGGPLLAGVQVVGCHHVHFRDSVTTEGGFKRPNRETRAVLRGHGSAEGVDDLQRTSRYQRASRHRHAVVPFHVGYEP